MKTSLFATILFLGISLFPLRAETVSDVTASTDNRSVQPYSAAFEYQTSTPVNIQTESFSLLTDSGSLQHDLAIQLSVISYKGGTLMPSNMENVCRLSDGVRLLPNGQHFADSIPALISLAYDPDRIPRGYTPKDVYSFYCDDAHSWHRLERISIDTARHIVTSYTTHFTDFANAVIKVPDMPESKAFVPTAMTDLPDVNPMQGIPMIEVPTPNNRGTAELTYPIEIPQGRQGLQPNVDLHYSSSGGNGILGVGWSLNTPAITLDTRWGAPRFDPNNETEQYLVNGAPILQRQSDGTALALPYQSNSYLPRDRGEVRFYARDTKNADRIIRYGTDPTNYWWAVTDRNGITTYYGRTFKPDSLNNQNIDEQSVVRTQNRCIAYWAATATVDVFGNYILYQNQNVGNNIYVQMIYYTGNYMQHVYPRYRIHMRYTDRTDVYSNGRLGVLQVDEQLLCHILVQYMTKPQRPTIEDVDNLAAYYFQYTEPHDSTLFKSRLKEVVMLDSVHDLVLDTVCDLDFIEKGGVGRSPLGQTWLAEVEAGSDLYEQMLLALSHPYGTYGIPANTTTFTYNSAPSTDNLFSNAIPLANSADYDISKSNNHSWSVGGTATVGVGFNVLMTTFSGGGNYDYSRSKGGCKTMLLDLNGDGLLDIVYEENGEVWYKPQRQHGDSYGFDPPERILGLTRLSREITDTHTWGLQLSLGVNLSYSHPTTTTYTDTYFADVNADGLPDMIDGDYILINSLDDGTPRFGPYIGTNTQRITIHNSHCEQSIILDGEVDEHIECNLEEVLVGQYLLSELTTYNLNEDIIEDDGEDYPSLHYPSDRSFDNVDERVKLRLSNNDKITSLRHNESVINRTQTDRLGGNFSPNDSLIYRIEDGYVNEYRLEYSCTPVKKDPTIETVRVWVAPKGGYIHLRDSIRLLEDTSATRRYSTKADGVTYCIQHCDSVTPQLDNKHLHSKYYSILKKGSLEATNYHDTLKLDTTFHVKQGDAILFRLRSGDNNRFDKTNWRHIINYSNETLEYDSQNDFICTGEGYFKAIQNGSVKLSFSGSNEGTSSVNLIVQKGGAQPLSDLLNTSLPSGTINITLPETNVSANDSIIIHLIPQSGTNPQWSDIHLIPKLLYISNFSSGNTIPDTITYYPDVHIQITPEYPLASPYSKLFGTIYKGWGMFAYQDINNRDTIILDSLVNTQQVAAEYACQDTTAFAHYQSNLSFNTNGNWQQQINSIFSNGHIFNPTEEKNYWIPMRADSRTEQWIAYGNLGCIGKNVHSNAREISMDRVVEDIVEYDSSLPFSKGSVRKNNFVRKQSSSTQNCISLGAMMSPINQSMSFGDYESIVDYMDMNGDGYPDFVGKDGIQYSTPWGGIGRLLPVSNYTPFKSTNSSTGTAFSGAPARSEKIVSNSVRSNDFNLLAPLGGSVGAGGSSVLVNYVDMNADGLPDKVDMVHHTVRYNLGYAFSNPDSLMGNINEGENSSGSLNLGLPLPFSLGQVSISAGMGGSWSEDKTDYMLADINGDGLPDRIWKNGSQVKVAYNKGVNSNGVLFDDWKDLPNAISNISRDTTENISTTLGITGGFSILGLVKVNVGVQSSPYSVSTSEGKVTLADMNGDGLIDYVYKVDNGQIYVRFNTAGKANLLSSVTNPTGQKIQLRYKLSQPSVHHRSRQWELDSISDYEASHPMQSARSNIMVVEYDSAYYDNYERSDYGYAHVRTTTNNEKVKKEHYYNCSLLHNGELLADTLSDINGNLYISHQHGSIYLSGGGTTTDIDKICDDANTQVQKDGYLTMYYETESSPQIVTSYTIEYDQYHNIVRYIDEGDVSINSDNWTQKITYLENESHNMVSLPKTEQIYNNAGDILRSSYINYDSYGKPAHIHFKDTILNTDAVTHLLYDDFGNIETVIYPTDANGDNFWSTFVYDDTLHSCIVAMDNSNHLTTFTDYEYRWGLPVRITDPSNNVMKYGYDYKGRLVNVLAPQEFIRDKDYTIKYTYNLINHDRKNHPSYLFTHVYKDMYDSLFVQREISLYDKRGRMIQKKHYAEVNGHDEWVVDKAETWDAFGRPVAREYPFVSQTLPYEYEPVNNTQAVVDYTYDIMDRILTQSNADNSAKIFLYHFKQDTTGIKRLLTRTTDENGLITATLKSPQDWLIQQEAGDGSKTHFEYSPIGELLRSTDAEGYQTSYSYDMLGRMLTRTHPDAGVTTMTYDLAGNMLTKQTANLIYNQDNIQYVYNYSRLTEIHYPLHTSDNVTYQYGADGRLSLRKDGVGSEEFIYDRLGNIAESTRKIVIPTESNAYVFKIQYEYDSFGRMRKITYPDGEIVRYGYTTGGLLTNVTGYKNGIPTPYLKSRLYDEQSRKKYQLDGNDVWSAYTYDAERQWLKDLYTELPDMNVLQDLEYGYDYVGNIETVEQSARSVYNSCMSSPIGGEYQNDYDYDGQYRLYKSNGYGDFPYYLGADYSPSGRMGEKITTHNPFEASVFYGYDRQHLTHQPRTAYIPTSMLGYESHIAFYWDKNGNLAQIIDCDANAVRLHEWDEENRLRFMIGDRYAGFYGYDANGERVYKLTGICSFSQFNSGSVNVQAIFDDAALYPNPYIVITPRGYTKHYYAGTERLATVIGSGGFNDMIGVFQQPNAYDYQNIINPFYSQYNHHTEDPFYYSYEKALSDIEQTEDIYGEQNPDLAYQCSSQYLEYVDIITHGNLLASSIDLYAPGQAPETDRYYYHGDHLGSANWITDDKGDPVQYIHYAPYGELIANQRPCTYDERFKFTGKERDAESGYDFFGARYWSCVFGHWLSVDPLADKYPNISPYAYCSWNPIKYKDPNGKWLETAWDIANVAMDISSLKSNISNDNVGGAVVDGIGLMLDLGATILPAVPGGAGTAIKASLVADKISDAASMSKQGQKAKGIGSYIKPNGGNAKPHGGAKHNSAIDKSISRNKQQGKQNIRKNQTQVDVNGNKVGSNRPDVQYDENGQHVCVEFDTKSENGLKHQQTIQANDPNAKVILKTVE